jgi:multimeric flavodoxin WrbA
MKILAIHGSPKREGASSKAASELIRHFEKQGNEIKQYHLDSLNIHGCRECFLCRTNRTDVCAVNDDLSEILESAKDVDLLIISSPIFFADISAQLKCFIDRTWSYFGKNGTSAGHLPRNRCLVFILSYGYTDGHIYDSIFDKYKRYFNMMGFDHCHLITACGAQYHSPEIVNEREVERMIENIVTQIKSAR